MMKSQTNLYQEQNPEPYRLNMKAWEPVTVNELRVFLALTINMIHVRKSKLENYWSTDPLLSTPISNTVMCRNRYLQILRFLHFANNDDLGNHPLKNVKPVIDDLRVKFSPEFLHDKDKEMYGTLRKNRKSVPKLNAKLNKGHVEVAHNYVWLILKWMDKKEVYMITTVHKLGFSCTVKKDWKTGENIIKLTCILEYNQNMGAVDNIDRQLSLTETTRKSMKWYRKFVFHLVDLSLANAHTLYNQRADIPLSFPKFRLEVVRNMLGIDSNRHSSSIQSSNLRLSGRHFAVLIISEDSSKILQHLNATYVMKQSALGLVYTIKEMCQISVTQFLVVLG
ncbi:piggyBac transposable element-derived protein 4-like [Prorops nasuta]|uniref:piggyBac transposable element-derived protein 4-like n=1 Tax=Prorops nasuta TaxID=863751 RepID=UPI0034CE8073